MLTGDNRTTAEAVARKLGIAEIEAEILPQDKGKVVERLRRQGRIVAMAGDGVNDAPALAAADVGVAMGTGTDVAIESAGVTLLRGDLQGMVIARRLSQATMRNIRQNLVFAFVYNAAGVPIAAGVLYPVFGLLLSPTRRRRGDGAVLGQRHRQRAEAQAPRTMRSRRWPAQARFASSSRICVRRTTSWVGGAGGGGSLAACRVSMLIPLIAMNSAMATIAKLITTVMKSP